MYLKDEVRNGWHADDKQMLMRRIKRCISFVDFGVVQRMLKSIKSKVKSMRFSLTF